MWLINTNSLKLEWFVDPSADNVRYAILSHTWGSDEVSFQDFANLDNARRKLGFDKIARTCQLAQSEGYEYTWVDTCCINKQSSAELSEAINSMYYWYEAADVCYALLSDLHEAPFTGLPDGFELLDKHGLKQYRDAVLQTPFARCRWFARGWTLQELIAPSRLIFYDASWCKVSDKITVRHVIKLITGVDAKVLLNNSTLLSKSVWRRMSWAANRETSRTEDIAYCLLGIFDISMPLIYGEGSKAFQRLQEEITRKEGDPSILLWSPEGMPLPQYRPARYRHADKPPVYRGAFAWAPSEFFNRDTLRKAMAEEARYDSNHIAVPARAVMSSQSSFVLQGGVICVMEHRISYLDTYFGTYLELQTSKGVVYRPVEKMSDGYVFENAPCGQPRGELLPYKAQELRLLGQHTTTLIEANKQRTVCLGIDDGGSVDVERITWPEHRWDEDPTWWVYNDAEIVRGSNLGPTVLGVSRFTVQVRVGNNFDSLSVHPLTLACIVGILPPSGEDSAGGSASSVLSRLFGVCFVKESNSATASALHNEMQQKDADAAVAFMQAYLRKHPRGFGCGRSEVVELSGYHGQIKRIRVVCSYSNNVVEHNNSLIWRVRLGLEQEEHYGLETWQRVDWGNVVSL